LNKTLFFDGFIERIKTQFNLEQNYAFEIFAIAPFLEMTFSEVFDDVSTLVDGKGNNDGGLDGIYLDQEENKLHVFQIKNKNTIGDNDIHKFLRDYENIFVTGNNSAIPLNKRVQAALDQYTSIVKSGKVIETSLYYIFNGEKSSINENIINRHEQSNPHLRIFDSNDLYAQIELLLLANKKRKDVSFSFMAEKSNISFKNDPQALISFQIQNIKAINFRLKAVKLCELLENEIAVNKSIQSVFSENIRGFLGRTKTNKKIKETLESNYAEYFPFLNNGITIIAEQIKIPQSMQAGEHPIETKNPVIVNGLQTTRVIYDVYKQDRTKLEGVYVLIRLYETNEKDLIDKITDATNTQSPINFRDKMSNKNFNEITKTFFAQKGIDYLTKRGEILSLNADIAYKNMVHSDIVLKFWYASFRESPEEAKNSKSKVLETIYDASIDSEHSLHPLFNGDKNSPVYEQLFTAYSIYKFVLAKRKEKEAEPASSDFVLYADELLSYGLYKKNVKTDADFLSAYDEIYNAIEENVSTEKKLLESNGKNYSHNGYFKSSKCRYDLNQKLNFIESQF